MGIYVAVLLFLVGALIIIKGGDLFVDASGWTSDVTGISRVVIGATLVSLATTSPEYFVSLIAALKGATDLAIGNAVGSLIANIGIAFALLAITTSGKVNDKLFGIKGLIMIFSTVMLFCFCINGILSVLEGIILFVIFIVFTLINIKFSKEDKPQKIKSTNTKEIIINIIKFIVGAAGIIYGSNLIVDNGQIIAQHLGVSEAVIGLTVVAIGTSLPEIVTSVTAIIKKESALSIGNIIGANTLDATLILATGSFISGGKLTVSPLTVFLDIPVAIALMLLAVIPTALGKKVYRWQGVFIAIVYISYLLYITFVRS